MLDGLLIVRNLGSEIRWCRSVIVLFPDYLPLYEYFRCLAFSRVFDHLGCSSIQSSLNCSLIFIETDRGFHDDFSVFIGWDKRGFVFTVDLCWFAGRFVEQQDSGLQS